MSPIKVNGYKVLVVDDDQAVLSTYKRLLRRSGFTAVTFSNPLQVLENGSAADADLLLLDYRMPGLDGLSLLAELRRRECKAPVILVTAYLNEDVIQQARQLGVAKVLQKPVDAPALRSDIFELLAAAVGQSA
jgi:two-component system response regulator (stage 0 sporulation protein F)